MRSSEINLKFGVQYGDVEARGGLKDMGEEMERSSSEYKFKFIIRGNIVGANWFSKLLSHVDRFNAADLTFAELVKADNFNKTKNQCSKVFAVESFLVMNIQEKAGQHCWWQFMITEGHVSDFFAWWTRMVVWCCGSYCGLSICDEFFKPPVPCTNAALRTIAITPDIVTDDANTGGEKTLFTFFRNLRLCTFSLQFYV